MVGQKERIEIIESVQEREDGDSGSWCSNFFGGLVANKLPDPHRAMGRLSGQSVKPPYPSGSLVRPLALHLPDPGRGQLRWLPLNSFHRNQCVLCPACR